MWESLVKWLEGFGSSSAHRLVKVVALVWLQFGYSSGVWTKQKAFFFLLFFLFFFACDAFGSQTMKCISESPPMFWFWDYTRGGESRK